MIEFILVILGGLFYFTLSSRISSLESKIRELKTGERNIVPKPDQVLVSPLVMSSPTIPMSVSPQIPQAQNNTLSADGSGINEATGGRILAIMGIIAVFLGLAFFLKFAFDNNLITVFERIILGYVVGVLAVFLGIGMRERYAEYADTLTGGGLAVLFLTR